MPLTARQRHYRAVLAHFEEHVRAVTEISRLAIVRADSIAAVGRVADLSSKVSMCEAMYKRLVHEEAMRRLGIRVGRRVRRRLAGESR